MTFLLYGTPGSLYTGKARSYLIKQSISFQNRAAGEARFREEIVPKIGRWIIPVLESADGEILQDGSDIIDHFEAKGTARLPAYPATPLHRLIGQIFELFGGEGLLRPAMHFRWNFDETNQAFLSKDFPAALAPTGATAEVQAGIFAMASGRMRKAMRSFGVTPDSIPAIEASYAQFLRLFDDHLEGSPYLLGGRPTIGDYGLVAPLYAHLARDPFPAQMMNLTDELPDILADERALKQILLNLVSNAIKFTPPWGRVEVFAALTAGGDLAFGVQDTGMGIAEDDKERVFESFGQGRHDVASADKGTGLGLPIVKGLVREHGGRIALSSRIGEGTRVTVYLPATRVLENTRAA